MIRSGITITIVDPDDDYEGIEVRVANDRFAGATWIYAGRTDLSKFAGHLSGFPRDARDERIYVFGNPDASIAGGYCRFRFYCEDRAGHIRVEIEIDEDRQRYGQASAQFSFAAEAAAVDRFALRLRQIELERRGEAFMPSCE